MLKSELKELIERKMKEGNFKKEQQEHTKIVVTYVVVIFVLN